MYRSRATILTPKSFTTLSKVCRQAHHLESLKFVTFSRNISTATQMSEIDNYSGLKGENYCDFQHNPDGVFNYNSNNTDSWNNNKNFSPIPQNGVYSRNSRRTEQNPSGVYGQTPRTEYQEPTGGAKSYFSKDTMGFQQNPRVQDENFSSGSVNVSSRNKPQQTVWQKDNGYRGEHGRHYQQNSNGYYGGNSELSQQNFSGNYTSNVAVPRQDLHQNYNSGNVISVQGENTGTYPQSASGYNVERYMSSSGYSREMMGQYQQNVRNFDPSGNGHQVSYQPQNRIVERQDMGTSIAVEQSNDSADSNKMKGSIDELDNFCQEGKLKEAVEVLHMLDQQHITVDLSRYTMLMDVCSEDKSLEEAKSVHEHLVRSYPHLDVKMYNKILEMYGKCGSMKDAFPVFEKMPQRNLASWDTMITWLSKNGHGEDAIELFAEFKKTGMKPDGQMFLGVFHACSVVGDTVEGMLHFESMSKYYYIVPSDEHYVGVVGMLGSTGYLNEAMEFIEKMPVEPSIEVWETMMNHCRIHGDLELGDRCAEIVELLDPSRLDEQLKAGFLAVKASDIAKEKEKKKLSQSLLEARSRVHEYRAGDRSHPDHEKIYELLGGLKQLMKEDGYIPEVKFVLHDVDQETKEDALMAHSERLAFAQGLMSSPARSQIRIIKNLRVCGDCHNALKIASKLVGREIVMRDAKRFHHVKDGLCSCKDYW